MEEKDERYKGFIKAINIEKIYLKTIDVNRLIDINSEKGNLELDLQDVVYNYNEDNGNIIYEVNVNIMGHFDNQDKDEEHFHINATYVVIYSLKEQIEITDDILERYEKNAIFNVWPYIRNVAGDMSNKMELSLPPVPLFKF